MPELPEVETLKLGLQKYVVGHTIESVDVKKPKIFQGDKKYVEGAKVQDVRRFGKGLVIDLSNNYSLAIHIKLTGQLIYRNKELGITNKAGRVEVPNNWTHVIFHLDKRATLYYNDIRQFGWIKVVPTSEVQNLPFFKELGPEFPLGQPHSDPLLLGEEISSNLTVEQFSNVLSHSKTAIKPLLMDQKKMSGIGNIYANDSLYLAKIDPHKPANSLSAEEVKTLFKAIETVLKKGLKEGGASELTFVHVLGESGNYQNHTQIYAHQGQKCKRDGTIIKKFVLGGRGTYMCSTCQK